MSLLLIAVVVWLLAPLVLFGLMVLERARYRWWRRRRLLKRVPCSVVQMRAPLVVPFVAGMSWPDVVAFWGLCLSTTAVAIALILRGRSK